jgi:hypothetical protein
MNNLAMMEENPASLPYFSIPTQGTNTILRSVTATYTPGWDFITAAGYYFSRWVFDHETAAAQAHNQNSEAWQMLPTTNPDKINLIKCAYLRTLGSSGPDCEAVLEKFFNQYKSPFNYRQAFQPGWYCVGRKHDVPKKACYVAHCGKTYVWVMPENMEALSRFTLAVMDIVTADPQGYLWQKIDQTTLRRLFTTEEKSLAPHELLLRKQMLQELSEGPVLQPRSIPMIPYPAPPSH